MTARDVITDGHSNAKIKKAARKLAQANKPDAVFLKLGREGSSWDDHGNIIVVLEDNDA
jgi:sugar/nucleoside kinase (ribokinase family)